MPFSFPSSPTVGQTSTQNDRAYLWTGHAWELVAASGGGGVSDDSRWNFFKPPAPTGVAATAGNAQVSLSWTAPTVLAQTPITDYVVQFSSNSGSTWTTFSDGTSTATSATVTGLTNGTAYVFRVAAVNGVGTGAYTAATDSVTPGGVFRAIPTMTSNEAPSGVVTGVSSGPSPANAYIAFDGDSATWYSINRHPNNDPKRSLQYAFPAGEKSLISGYSMALSNAGGPEPVLWNFYGSDDLSSWTLLESQSSNSGGYPQPTPTTFTLPQPANFRAYRWVFFENADASGDHRVHQIGLIQ